MPDLTLQLGVKTDPIEYRYTYPWLFRLMADEGIHHAQLGSFFELFQLPDEYFVDLRRQAEEHGVKISSVFTAHRELGGFFRRERGWAAVTRRSYERMIEIGALLGSENVGSSPGAVMRDEMDFKEEGMNRYIGHMKELMSYAHQHGIPCLTLEPMSCLAEPPTLPHEMQAMVENLIEHHQANPDQTVPVGLCTDISHGYADQESCVKWDNVQLLETAIPYTRAVHLKNTDEIFDNTFGFAEEDRARGIVQVEEIRDLFLSQADRLPVNRLVGYLEIGGPKIGRDYSDCRLGDMLRKSLRYLRHTWSTE